MIAIELDWIEAPDSGDLLLAKTWARLSLRYADVALTRVFDRSSRTEREAIHVPLYPLARWVVDQWWPLLYEPLAADFKLPEPGADANRSNETIRAWLSKHCFRVAIPGYAFPYLCVFSNGPDLMLVTKADPHGRYRHTAAEFCESRIGPASRETMKQELARLVEGVLSRLETVNEPRAIKSGGPTQTAMSVTRAAGILPNEGCDGPRRQNRTSDVRHNPSDHRTNVHVPHSGSRHSHNFTFLICTLWFSGQRP